MNPLHLLPLRPVPARRRVVLPLLQTAVLAVCLLPAGGCSSTNTARVESAARAVYQDATSAAGRALLADVTSSALRVGLDLASGDDAGATVAGIQGAASAVRDYEGLPVAPSSAAVARAAAAGSGVTNVAAALAPGVETLLDNARTAAAQQKIRVSADDIIEALARGFDAVADARYTPALGQ